MAGDEPEPGARRGEHRAAWIGAGAAVAAAEPAVAWRGDVVFDGSGKDFDVLPPREAVDTNDFGTGGTETVELHPLDDSLLATWNEERTPGYADCAEAAPAAGVYSHPLEVGTVLCGLTEEGRVVRFTVVEFPDQYGPYAAFEAVVWEPA